MPKVTVTADAMIGFSANKTASQAAANAADLKDRLTLCSTGELYINGARLGFTDVERSAIDSLVKSNATSAVTVTCTAAPNPFELHGYDNDQMMYFVRSLVTLTVKYGGSNVQATNASGTAITSITLTNSSTKATIVLTWDATSKTYQGRNGDGTAPSSTGTFSSTIYVKATSHGNVVVSKSASVAISGADHIYFGTSAAAQLTAANITAFDRHTPTTDLAANVIKLSDGKTLASAGTLKSTARGTSLKFTFKAGEYAYIFIPSWINQGSFSTGSEASGYHATEGVADVIFIKQAQIATTAVTADAASSLKRMAQTFNVYRLQSTQAAGTHTFTI